MVPRYATPHESMMSALSHDTSAMLLAPTPIATALALLVLRGYDAEVQVVSRDELHKIHVAGKDLIISVGGDGTCLSASHYINDRTPMLAINSDPTKQSEKGLETRRSVGALCACSKDNMKSVR